MTDASVRIQGTSPSGPTESFFKQPSVMVAMSGGVDSSVAAYLLTQQRLQVTGVTLKLFHNEDLSSNTESQCCSSSDIEDARQVCLDLDIPHWVFNFSGTFTHDVMDRFCESYVRGETPNPCIDCNRYIKFDALQKRREALGFDYVATGHYARIVHDKQTGRYLLKAALDKSKDQSYVLYHLTQDYLAHMMFPLGELSKRKVREIAAQEGFINAKKPDSQDICFVPDGDYAAFIAKRLGIADKPGDIVLMDGTLVGTHQGLSHYTLGQRKGIGVAGPEPYYVFNKDLSTNTLTVGVKAEVQTDKAYVNDINLISREDVQQPLHVTVKTHYRQAARPATIIQTGEDTITIHFDAPQTVCAPGQAAVFYDGDIVVGGGTLIKAE